MLQEIEIGNHVDKRCKEYCRRYTKKFGQKLPKCKFKGNKSIIQDLIRKIHIDDWNPICIIKSFFYPTFHSNNTTLSSLVYSSNSANQIFTYHPSKAELNLKNPGTLALSSKKRGNSLPSQVLWSIAATAWQHYPICLNVRFWKSPLMALIRPGKPLKLYL